MTPGELRQLIRSSDTPIYKVSLGDDGRYRDEAFREGVLVFQSEIGFYQAVSMKDEAAIRRSGQKVCSKRYPKGNAPEDTIKHWQRNIEKFMNIDPFSIIIHWDSRHRSCLRWCITGELVINQIRTERDERGQEGIIFYRKLLNGWHRNSVGGLPLVALHPKAVHLAVNPGTIYRVRTDDGYFRSLITDNDTAEWETSSEWATTASNYTQRSKSRLTAISARRQSIAKPLDLEVLEWWDREISRMADTAIHTAAYANGQTVMAVVKEKEIGFTREELLEEIHHLIKKEQQQCALTGHVFKVNDPNPFLRPSLDRIDSTKGYVAGNLQVVTRAANFFKSASDEAEWLQKADAIYKMAVGMKRRRDKAMASPPKRA